MTRPSAAILLCAALAICPIEQAVAEKQPPQKSKSGEQVYNEVCIACHESGVAHAPKFGDKAAWAELIAEGQHVLTAHAWVGVRAMPAKGGNPDLTLTEFARGAAWMASHAGADWKDPDARMLARISQEARKRIDAHILELKKMKQDLEPNR